MHNLKDKTIWITGASKGIGAAIARSLADSDARLVLSASSAKSFDSIKREFSERKNVYIMPFDIADAEACKRAFGKIEALAGSVDILINNAGVASFAPFEELSVDQFDEMFGINVRGLFMCTKLALPGMLDRKSGMIMNILSNAALKTFPNSSVYAATKAAVRAISRSMREEIRGRGVKVVDIYPGATATDIWAPEMLDKFADKMMPPEDVANVVVHTIEMSMLGNNMVEEIVVRPQGGDL